jgi:hypothetical protein
MSIYNRRRMTLCAPVLVAVAVALATPDTASGDVRFARTDVRWSTDADGRTITVTGYAVCTSHVGISIPAPVACSSVTLNTSDGYTDSTSPKESSFPNEKGRFTFSNVSIPGRTDVKSITYNITAFRGAGLSSDSQGTCEYSGSIQGLTFQFDALDLFNPIDRGPWTLANQCNPP